ncbi:MAG: carbohydrate binding family 9 domain-containing protein [Saprospiraceae bacterium]|nr:carbohydrate binding family 9 domain-containing protein [Saprospiraceae bacterium]
MLLLFLRSAVRQLAYILPAWILLFQYADLAAQVSMKATRTFEKVEVDGVLDEESWSSLPIATDFIAWTPQPGLKASDETEVRFLYDDNSIYIAARMAVTDRDSIMTELTQRDDLGNTDWFGFVVDTYGNGNDGFEFIVGATGVQFDAKFSDQQGEDTNWDAVWFSSVTLGDSEWIAEIEIPYSALRFANKDVQSWKINFMRSIRRINEKSSWSFIDPKVSGFLTQAGTITDLEHISPPIRLSLSPYLSVYAQQHNGGSADPFSSTGYSYNGGMDLKYGINDAFTLDMVLVPDFGQVRSDDIILNLSPFEVRYDENRQFFTEGTELFNQDDLFYSRRIGGSPIGHSDVYHSLEGPEEITQNPTTSQLYNATKVSGRNSNGLGIGVFNAISRATHARIEDMESGRVRSAVTAPITNYNMTVLDQNLPNNSKISLANTNVWRAGDTYHDANVTSFSYDLKNKAQSYNIYGRGTVSQIIKPQDDNVNGYKYSLGLGKISGNLGFRASYTEISPDYNPNDFGFLRINNLRSFELESFYRVFNPFGPFNRGNFWNFFTYDRIVEPDAFTSMHFNIGFWVESKGFWNFNMWSNYRPTGYDYNEPRSAGRYYEMPSWWNTGFWVGSDSRKKFRMQGFGNYRRFAEDGRYSVSIGMEPRYRFSNKLTMSFELDLLNSFNDKGYVNQDEGEVVFGNRDQVTFENSIYAAYTFNDKMGIDFRLRHYWSKVAYDSFYDLTSEGRLTSNDYNNFHDFSFNVFNIDLNYRWRFAPGSDLFIVWKNNISGFSSDQLIDYESLDYSNGVSELGDLPQTNSLSLRVVYYIDYASVKRLL